MKYLDRLGTRAQLGLFFGIAVALSVAVAWKSRVEGIANAAEIDRIRQIQVQRGERIGAVEARVDAVEKMKDNPRVMLRWPSGLIAVEQEQRGATVQRVVSDFNELSAAFPPRR